MMTDCLHTENTKGNGGPQADEVGNKFRLMMND